jgi:predicted DNA-binding transcriptional regulator AlpA
MKNARPQGESELWYDIRKMMELFDCTDATIRVMEARGQIPRAVRRSRRWTRWVKSEVDQCLKDMLAKPRPI